MPGTLQPQSFWNQNTVKQIETPLHYQREQGCRNRALQDRQVIVQIQTTQDRLAQTACTDQSRQGSRSDIDDRTCLDAGENRARSDGQVNFDEPRPRFEPESNSGVANGLWNVLQSGGGVPHNREK